MRRAPLTLSMAVVGLLVAPSPSLAFGDGTFVVGQDIGHGTYAAPGGDGCYWARLSGFGGTLDEIIANGNPTGPVVVTIAASDAGFETRGCGEWLVPIAATPPPTLVPAGSDHTTLADISGVLAVYAEDMADLFDRGGSAGVLSGRVDAIADRMARGLAELRPHPCHMAGYLELAERVGGLRLWARMLEERPRVGLTVYDDEELLDWFFPELAVFTSDACPPEVRG
jgi:hypothetical protein